jgi:hypothetical protein
MWNISHKKSYWRVEHGLKDQDVHVMLSTTGKENRYFSWSVLDDNTIQVKADPGTPVLVTCIGGSKGKTFYATLHALTDAPRQGTMRVTFR